MSIELNTAFQSWLDTVFTRHVDIVEHELGNRFDAYSALQECFTSRPIDVACFRERAGKPSVTATNILMGYEATRSGYARLLDDESPISYQIAQLIDRLPDSDEEMVRRIDEFVAQGKLRSGLKPSEVLTIASLILTLTHPSRFVDFPSHATWRRFAQGLGYVVMGDSASHGEKLMWASMFARELSETDAFAQRWPHEAEQSMWVVSALNWTHRRISKKDNDTT